MKYTEIADIISGGTPKTSCPEYWDGDIPWLSVVDFSNCDKYVYTTERSITEKGLNNSSTKLLQKDDIIISARGTIGAMAMIPYPMAFNQSCFGIRAKDGIDSHYLFYLTQIKIKELQTKSKNGNIFKSITLETFENINVELPSLEEQKKIAKILSDIDQKISLNNSINKELEQMAKEIYDYWFVQFDFPDENGRPYKSSGGKMVYNPILKRDIPLGWEVKTLDSILNKISSGNRPGPIDKTLKDGIPSLGAECIDTLGVFNFEKTPFVAYDFQSEMTRGKIEDKDILIYKDGAYVGKTTLFQDSFPYKEAYVNEHVFLVNTKDKFLQYYLFFTLNQPIYFDIMQALGKAKAAQPGLNQQDLKNIKIIIPHKDTYTAFYKNVSFYLKNIFNNSLQNKELQKQRDELLPLLMTGQVKVK